MRERFTYYIPKELHIELEKEAAKLQTSMSKLLASILDTRYASRRKTLATVAKELAMEERKIKALRSQFEEMSQDTAEWEELRDRYSHYLYKLRSSKPNEWTKDQWLAQIKKEYPHIKNIPTEEIRKRLEEEG